MNRKRMSAGKGFWLGGKGGEVGENYGAHFACLSFWANLENQIWIKKRDWIDPAASIRRYFLDWRDRERERETVLLSFHYSTDHTLELGLKPHICVHILYTLLQARIHQSHILFDSFLLIHLGLSKCKAWLRVPHELCEALRRCSFRPRFPPSCREMLVTG